jgi:hypothetical protein
MATEGGPNIITDGLVLALDAASPRSYPGTGTTWYDVSGYGNNGTLTNGPTFNSGSIVFDGVNDYLKTPSIPNFRTISLWVKTSNTGTGWKYLVDARTGMPNGWYTGFSGGSGIGGNWTSQYVNGVLTTVNFDNITLGIWCNLVITSNTSYTSDITFMSRYSNSEPLAGYIANIMIHNKALSAEEVLQNYNATKSRFI